MKRKVLQEIVNNLCHMLLGWRMAGDLEKIAKLPDGILEFDLLESNAVHNSAGPISLQVTDELSSWLKSRLNEYRISLNAIEQVTLIAGFRTDRIATDRKSIVSFDWRCDSTLCTNEKVYSSKLVEKHIWHKRKAT